MSFKMPSYMLEYTPRTITNILCPDAIEGKEVEIDVYHKSNVGLKLVAKGFRVPENRELFRVITEHEGKVDEMDWSFNILRESADRAKKRK